MSPVEDGLEPLRQLQEREAARVGEQEGMRLQCPLRVGQQLVQGPAGDLREGRVGRLEEHHLRRPLRLRLRHQQPHRHHRGGALLVQHGRGPILVLLLLLPMLGRRAPSCCRRPSRLQVLHRPRRPPWPRSAPRAARQRHQGRPVVLPAPEVDVELVALRRHGYHGDGRGRGPLHGQAVGLVHVQHVEEGPRGGAWWGGGAGLGMSQPDQLHRR